MARKRYFTIYSVGHDGLTSEEFVERLKARGVGLVVDVRNFPYSHQAEWFNRDKIENALRKNGIEYVFLGSYLGAITDDGRFDFVAREKDPRYQEGIKLLLEYAQSYRVAIMSAEPNYLISHRHQLIAQTLLKLSVEVIHINEANGEEPAQPDLFHTFPEETGLFNETFSKTT